MALIQSLAPQVFLIRVNGLILWLTAGDGLDRYRPEEEISERVQTMPVGCSRTAAQNCGRGQKGSACLTKHKTVAYIADMQGEEPSGTFAGHVIGFRFRIHGRHVCRPHVYPLCLESWNYRLVC